MAANILVATPQAAFGELLRLSLEETGGFSVRLVQSSSEARAAAGRLHFDLAILDDGLPEPAFTAFAEALRSQSSGMRLVVISPENTAPSYNGLNPDAVLSKPFYMPDLLEKVHSMVGRSHRPAADTTPLPALNVQLLGGPHPPPRGRHHPGAGVEGA
jgi:DNA-binding response OmpR family regulator